MTPEMAKVIIDNDDVARRLPVQAMSRNFLSASTTVVRIDFAA